jgi:hypothetical protein
MGRGLTPYTGRFNPKKDTQHSFHKRMGEPLGSEWQRKKLYPPSDFEPRFDNPDGHKTSPDFIIDI